jgi:citrate lyase subunit beta / citryl-CoA lyase
MTSYLFTPAHVERLTSRAHERGADVVLLDLEDAVPPAQKAQARAGLSGVVAGLKGARVAVRVNAPLGEMVRDIEAAVQAGVETIMLPKVASAALPALVAQHLAACEAEAGQSPGKLALIALIESAEGVLNAPNIARVPRVTALALGPEDLCADLGIAPSVESLTAPAQQLIWAAKAAGISALGLPDSIAIVQDASRFEASVALGQRLGFDGVLCIHPAQVSAVNRLYGPAPEAVAAARRLVAAYQAAGGGAILFEGRMVDAPIVAQALTLLRRNPDQTVPA